MDNIKIKTFQFSTSSSKNIDDTINKWINDSYIKEIVDIKINSIIERNIKNGNFDNFSNSFLYTIIYK